MENESGEWIMHGMKWDNPECIQSVDEAIEYINMDGMLQCIHLSSISMDTIM